VADVEDKSSTAAAAPVSADGSAADDSASDISNEEIIYRLLFPNADWISVDKITGERRPSSAAFKPDEDGVSVYREAILTAERLGPSDLTRTAIDPVVAFTAADVRGVGLDLLADPWPQDVPDPKHRKHAAHALISGLNALGPKPQLAVRRKLAKAPSMKFVQG
jgi:hypothetical protein